LATIVAEKATHQKKAGKRRFERMAQEAVARGIRKTLDSRVAPAQGMNARPVPHWRRPPCMKFFSARRSA
jgi:4'-phosphopantetheinyl transferase EntD